MYYACIDTCVLLDLAKDPATLEKLRSVIERGKLRLLIPEPIIEEFRRHKPTYAARVATSQRKTIRDMRVLLGMLGPGISETTTRDIVSVQAMVDRQEQAAYHILAEIDGLLTSSFAVHLEASQAVRLRAGERAKEKRAPFGNKNSWNDAVIFEAFAAFCETCPEGDIALFITSNTDDFSDRMDHRRPHRDLAAVFSGRVEYFINIAQALQRLDPTVADHADVERAERLGLAPSEPHEWLQDDQEPDSEGRRIFPYSVGLVMEEFALWLMRNRDYKCFTAPGKWPVFILADESGARKMGVETLIVAAETEVARAASSVRDNLERAGAWLVANPSAHFTLGIVMMDGFDLSALLRNLGDAIKDTSVSVVIGRIVDGAFHAV
jgi:hypothetical protein